MIEQLNGFRVCCVGCADDNFPVLYTWGGSGLISLRREMSMLYDFWPMFVVIDWTMN